MEDKGNSIDGSMEPFPSPMDWNSRTKKTQIPKRWKQMYWCSKTKKKTHLKPFLQNGPLSLTNSLNLFLQQQRNKIGCAWSNYTWERWTQMDQSSRTKRTEMNSYKRVFDWLRLIWICCCRSCKETSLSVLDSSTHTKDE